ncbi:MAG: hypothetical protein IT365_03110 [Candidatus Hydrogenedentes bacterium]|nr:hypothetical protein [Candidatus Hydrogenedentota bacterium]
MTIQLEKVVWHRRPRLCLHSSNCHLIIRGNLRDLRRAYFVYLRVGRAV